MKKLILVSIFFLTTSCVQQGKRELNDFTNWEYRKIVYEDVSETYVYPFEILLPQKAKIGFSFDIYADVILKNEDGTGFFFEIRPLDKDYLNLESYSKSYCDDGLNKRSLEIGELNKAKNYTIYFVNLPCTKSTDYAIKINNQFFYFAINPKNSREGLESIKTIINNLKITE